MTLGQKVYYVCDDDTGRRAGEGIFLNSDSRTALLGIEGPGMKLPGQYVFSAFRCVPVRDVYDEPAAALREAGGRM